MFWYVRKQFQQLLFQQKITYIQHKFIRMDALNTNILFKQQKESGQKTKTVDKVPQEKTNKIRQYKRQRKPQRWSDQQNRLYVRFLEQNGHLFRHKSVRRNIQIFTLLAERMKGRRSASQCKSHHQKMKNATEKGTIKEIIAYMNYKNIQKKQINKYIVKSQMTVFSCPQYSILFNHKPCNFQFQVQIDEDIIISW